MTAQPPRRVALVHDWLTGMRGGEKVLAAIGQLYPDAPIFTLLHVPGTVSADIEAHAERRDRGLTVFHGQEPAAEATAADGHDHEGEQCEHDRDEHHLAGGRVERIAEHLERAGNGRTTTEEPHGERVEDLEVVERPHPTVEGNRERGGGEREGQGGMLGVLADLAGVTPPTSPKSRSRRRDRNVAAPKPATPAQS